MDILTPTGLRRRSIYHIVCHDIVCKYGG